MYRFASDYQEGCHPRILKALTQTNLEQTVGYGCDPYCDTARDLIRTAAKAPDAEHQSRDLSPGHVAQASPGTLSRQMAAVV